MTDNTYEFLSKLPHSNNLVTKRAKEANSDKITTLDKLTLKYDELKIKIAAIEFVQKPEYIAHVITTSYNEYFNEIRESNKILNYTFQGKFISTVIEDLGNTLLYFACMTQGIDKNKFHIGSSKAFIGMNFNGNSMNDYVEGGFEILQKDQDASIYKKTELIIDDKTLMLNIPYISLECKTYIDKTMLEGAVATANKIKSIAPSSKFYIFAGRNAVAKNYNHDHHRIDGVFLFASEKQHSKANKSEIIIDGEVITIVLKKLIQDVIGKPKVDIVETGVYIK